MQRKGLGGSGISSVFTDHFTTSAPKCVTLGGKKLLSGAPDPL